jgi:uncharacterized membrane protein YeiH
MTPGLSIADWFLSYGTTTFEIIGTLAFALSGLIEAARKKLDIVGMAMVTFLAAFGGGTLRDILLDKRPFFWVENSLWIWVVLAMCALALVFMRARHVEPTERATAWPDAIGLGIFSAVGTHVALQSGVPAIVAVIMGVITAVFGGVLRDVVVNEIPRAFVDHQPYSVLAFAGGWVVVGLDAVGTSPFISVGLGALVVSALRFSAMIFAWRLPTWRV